MLSLPLPFFNPLKFFAFLFVFIAGLPLALCAGVTTVIAFLVLFLRLFLVYLDVGLETIRHILLGYDTHAGYASSHSTPAVTPGASTTSTFTPPRATTNTRHRNRLRRHGSNRLFAPDVVLEKLSTISPSIGLERDFEGVGGWRLDSTDNDTDEQQWHTLNSRLENPYRRHHFRSQSGGAVLSGHNATPGVVPKPRPMTRSHSPEHARQSSTPSRSTSRTPTAKICQELTRTDHDYFSMQDKNARKQG